MGEAEALEARDIRVHIRGVKAVDGVDLRLRSGEILGLIGPNGAGKTTLVNVLSGFQRATSGHVLLGGEDITTWEPSEIARAGLVRTFQDARLFAGLTVFENVEAAAVASGLGRSAARAATDQILALLQLEPRARLLAGGLPHGEQRRLAIARALAARPSHLLLDEPAAGLDESESDELVVVLAALRDAFGVGLLVIEHDMRLIMGLCEQIQVLDHGKTIALGHAGGDPRRRGRAHRLSRTGGRRVLSVADLTVRYGRTTAVENVSLTVAEGEIVGLVGANGAGKSTTLAAIAGLVPIAGGTITCFGHSLAGLETEDIARRGIALVLEGRHIFTTLSVGENLELGRTANPDRARTDARLAQVLERFPVLRKTYGLPAGTLSGGEQQQLAIGRALVADPRLLLLDEPSLGLSPMLVDEVFAAIAEIRDDGATVLLVEQNVRRTVQLADRTYVLRSGRIALSGARDELAGRSGLDAAYLGF